MYYLIVSIYTYSAVLIPNPYRSLDDCNKAGKEANLSTYRCIEVSKDDYCKYHYLTTAVSNQAITQKVCN